MKRLWLIQLRKSKNLTQEQVASMAFINRAYYAQIENGKRQPSITVAKNIASILGFNPSTFFMEEMHDPFQVSLKNAPIVVAHCDMELRYTWIFNPHADFDSLLVIGKTDEEIDSNPGTLALMELKREIVTTGKTIRRNISFPLSDGHLTYTVFGEPLLKDGEIIGASTASTEITFLLSVENGGE